MVIKNAKAKDKAKEQMLNGYVSPLCLNRTLNSRCSGLSGRMRGRHVTVIVIIGRNTHLRRGTTGRFKTLDDVVPCRIGTQK